jgi:hypothetical protein
VYEHSCPACGNKMQFRVEDYRWCVTATSNTGCEGMVDHDVCKTPELSSILRQPSTNADWLWNKFITTSLTPFVGSDASGFVPAENNQSLTQ